MNNRALIEMMLMWYSFFICFICNSIYFRCRRLCFSPRWPGLFHFAYQSAV